MRNGRKLSRVAAVAVLLALASLLMTTTATRAEFLGEFTLEVENSKGKAKHVFALEKTPRQGKKPAKAKAKKDKLKLKDKDNHEEIAVIESFEATLIGDPVVDINFVVTAGSADTTFTITSSLVTFPEMSLVDPLAWAEASVSLTDVAGDGASIAVAGNNGLFWADYNGTLQEAGTPFTDLIGTLSFQGSPGATVDDFGQARPPQILSGAVESIRAGFKFTLSSHDSASGNGHFEVIPEPSTVVMLGMGLLGLLGYAWRKRRTT